MRYLIPCILTLLAAGCASSLTAQGDFRTDGSANTHWWLYGATRFEVVAQYEGGLEGYIADDEGKPFEVNGKPLHIRLEGDGSKGWVITRGFLQWGADVREMTQEELDAALALVGAPAPPE